MISLFLRVLSLAYFGGLSSVRTCLGRVAAVTGGLEHLLSYARSPWQITHQWPAERPVFAGKVVLFAHQGQRASVAGYVLKHLTELRAAGCQILFVSNAGRLDEASRAALEPLCAAILVRRNWGGKWGAWREALRYWGEPVDLSLLLLLDDSIYGPLAPLQPLLERCERSRAGVTGLTDSWQYRWHLQCYFLAVRPQVLRHPGWGKFWRGCAPVRSKHWLYRHCDTMFSQTLLRADLQLEPIFKFHDLCAAVDRKPLESDPPDGRRAQMRYAQIELIDRLTAAHRPFDPTQMLWRQLLALGHPYLSRVFVRYNPERVRDAIDWRDELARCRDWDASLIGDDLATLPRRELVLWLLKAVLFVRKIGNGLIRYADEWQGVLIGSLRSHRQAVFVWPDHKIECGRRVMIFVHFDKNGEVRTYVLSYLRALLDAGVSVLFVSNSGRLHPDAIEKLKPLCLGIIVRRNVGYDFGAWREGLEYLKGTLDGLEWLALANDSVYGPLRPLQLAFNHIDFDTADVWGFTDSEQRHWHLQSYFLIFSRRVLRSAAWRAFWNGVKPVSSKSWAITNCEIKITAALQQAGFKCAALFPYRKLLRQVGTLRSAGNLGHTLFARLELLQRRNLSYAVSLKYPLNPCADLWRQLLRDDFPFLKRELLRSNPAKVPDSIDWQTEVAATSGADVRLIEEDLRKSVRGRLA